MLSPEHRAPICSCAQLQLTSIQSGPGTSWLSVEAMDISVGRRAWLWSACLGTLSCWKEVWHVQSHMSSSVCLVPLPKEAQLGKAGSSCWERPWGEKSHLLSAPQGQSAGLPKLEHALRQEFGDALPTAELEPPNQLLHSLSRLLSKVFAGEHPCQGCCRKDLWHGGSRM